MCPETIDEMTSLNLRDPETFRKRERGSILIVTIWVVLVLTGLALVFSRAMRVEAIATANSISSLKAEEIATGAMSFIKARLNETDTTLKLEGETPYKAISVGDGYFWLLRPNLGDDETCYYGIRDEVGKVNLNSASYEMLMKLPNMTSELAASIIDWRDTNSTLTEGGAESEYYLLLDNPYYCKNSELESVEEVLLIKGASQQILFGEDANRNGVLDANENDGDKTDPPDDMDGTLDRGFYDYVTVYSVEPNTDSSGKSRTNVTSNQSRLELQTLIQRVNSGIDQRTLGTFFQANRSFGSVLDFYIKAKNSSVLTLAQFKQIEDSLSGSPDSTVSGLINVNTAPKEVLMCIPRIEETDAEALVRKREADGTDTSSITWVYDAVPAKAAAIGSYITIHSYQYSADIISASGDGRSFCRYRMVADTRDSKFKVLYWKSLKHFGWPLDPEILTKLRAGVSSIAE
jgi:type II secretory pathway component PulK